MSDPLITLSDFHGQPALALVSGDGARATVLLHGAHLVSWATPDGQEQLYLSPQAVFDGRQAVRGGVPVIFPQFSDMGPLPRHGFARGLAWEPISLEHGASDALAVLRLQDSPATRALWARAFVAELSLRISGQRLDIELAIEHPAADADKPMGADVQVANAAMLGAQAASASALKFTAALHTYLRVADAANIHLDGLQRLRYDDRVRHTQQVDMAPRLEVAGELDRNYYDLARPLVLQDGPRRVEFTQQGFTDAVVWNPGAERCGALADMPADGWRQMMCVEAAAVGQPVSVAVGDCWIGRQTLTVLDTDPPSDAAGHIQSARQTDPDFDELDDTDDMNDTDDTTP